MRGFVIGMSLMFLVFVYALLCNLYLYVLPCGSSLGRGFSDVASYGFLLDEGLLYGCGIVLFLSLLIMCFSRFVL